MDNHILQLVTDRIGALIVAAKSSGALSHAGTVGTVREQQLRDFLSTLLPVPLAVTSGFISDSLGQLTPQLDLIVYDPPRLPQIAMSPDIAVVPSDSALLMAEIKSTLNTSVLDQALRQLAAIQNMAHSGTGAQDGESVIVPQIIVAFESEVSLETVDSWFAQCPNLLMVSVLSSATLAKTGESERTITLGSAANNYMNVRAFIVHFFSLLHQVAKLRRSISPQLAHYLMPEWRAPAG
jgi:hypothetical protein